MADYIPASDGTFDTWQGVFVTYAIANATALGLAPADVAALSVARTSWTSAFVAHGTAQASAESARQMKDDARDGLVGTVRSLVRQMQSNPAVTDAQRQAMGITVYDATRTAAPSPTTRPVVTVDTSLRLRHVIAFADEGTPTKKAKPAGVMGAELWVKIGDPPPTGPSELTFLSVDTRTPYTADFDGADAGKTAHYMVRWTNTRGEKGPWSETASATIGA